MPLLLFVFGAAVGSFLNVVSLRYVPEKFLFHRGVLGGRSWCRACGKTLRWFELIPLISFAIQGARCRSCKAALTLQYPIVEILGGLIFAFVPSQVAFVLNRFGAFSFFDFSMLAGLWVLVFLTLLLISAIDARTNLIPDEANIFLAVLGILLMVSGGRAFGPVEGSFLGHYALLFGVRESIWLNHLLAAALAAIAFGFIILITRGRAMGLGDLKLAAALGLVFGWPDILMIIVIAFIIGAIAGLAAIIARRKTMGSFVAFGPFLSLGALLSFFFGFLILDFYFKLFAL